MLPTRGITRCGPFFEGGAGSAHPLEIILLGYWFSFPPDVLLLCLCPLAILQDHLIYNLSAQNASPSPKMFMGGEEFLIDHHAATTMAIYGTSQFVFHLCSSRWTLDLFTFYQIVWPKASRDFLGWSFRVWLTIRFKARTLFGQIAGFRSCTAIESKMVSTITLAALNGIFDSSESFLLRSFLFMCFSLGGYRVINFNGGPWVQVG